MEEGSLLQRMKHVFSDNEDKSTLSRPRIVFEKPKNGDLRALVWNDSSKEDFEVKIGFK